MLYSLALIFLVGSSLGALCGKIGLPRLVGMLAAGILLGPYALNLLDATLLGISADLRQMALVIILLKAGLSLNWQDLKRAGRPALLMSFVPACFEIAGFLVLAPPLLGLSLTEAALMGSVLAAVSPAVIVPKMVSLIEQGYGVQKSIPQMILAGASLDDVFVIVLFTTFTGLAQGGSVSALSFARIPVSIIVGIALGIVCGLVLAAFFAACHKRNAPIRNSTKVVVLLGAAFLLVGTETFLQAVVPVSCLVAVIGMGMTLQRKSAPHVGKRLSEKLSKLWIAAELILFVLVGAAVDIRYAVSAGFGVVVLILGALLFRVAGVAACLLGTSLTRRERLFCMIAYLPKATVQAAIGAVPLSMGLPCGSLVLTVAVCAILITAPLGAFGIDASYRTCLTQASADGNPPHGQTKG